MKEDKDLRRWKENLKTKLSKEELSIHSGLTQSPYYDMIVYKCQ